MAFDTADKRHRILNVNLPIPLILPIPDGVIDENDRWAFLNMYASEGYEEDCSCESLMAAIEALSAKIDLIPEHVWDEELCPA